MSDLLAASRHKLEALTSQIIALELEIGMTPDAIAEAQWFMGQMTSKYLKPYRGEITEMVRLSARLAALKARRRAAEDCRLQSRR